MKDFSAVVSGSSIDAASKALKANGFEVDFVPDAAAARAAALALVPAGAEVFTSASITLDQTGLEKEINESGRYDAVKTKLYAMDQQTQGREMRKYGAAPDLFIGSAHAVTETGSIMVASLTGSQLPGIAYAAGKVVLVVGAQKLVKDLEEGFERIREYVTPKESVRARAAYGLPDSFNSYASKVLVFNREVQPGRVHVIIVNEALGF